MKVWIDLTSLPHVHFFRALVKRLEKEGNEVLVTSRDFGLMKEIMERNGIDHTSVGSHGGKDIREKLVKSSERIIGLAKLISAEKPDVALSKHSIECARVSFGLGIKSVMVIDHDTAAKQTRLTAPLSDLVVSPKATDMGRLHKYGAKDVLTFNGVCETAHFKDFKPNTDVLDKLGLAKDDKVIIARSEPILASHNFHHSTLFPVIEALKLKFPDFRIVFIPRHTEDINALKSLNLVIPDHSIDTLSLYSFASLMIGAGSCMNREASVGGCPTISICPDRLPGVDKFLIDKGLMHHSTDKDEILRIAADILSKDGKKERRVVEGFDDPYDKITEAISQLS